ncbi:unnamed protein product [Knipowitschia caucasica]
MVCCDWPSLLCFLCISMANAVTSSIPPDQEPISIVSWEQAALFPCFRGSLLDNDTQRLGLDFQRMIRVQHTLYIAARDHVFAVNLTTAAENFVPQTSVTWKSTDVAKCTLRGKNSDECYNYIKVLAPKDDSTLFTCGTNAFNPTCRSYKMGSLQQDGEDVVGQARCPFESGQSNVGIFAGGDFYSGTMTDSLASDAVIYRSLGDGRPVLRTVKYDSKWLREPHFLHAVDFGNYVYFFFREISVEYSAVGKVVFSRVGRVCKNDDGGSPRVLDRHWTSFLKARLNCSVSGDSYFYFDVLQSVTNVLQIQGRAAVVGVFTTQANSIPGSAVCAFFMDDIENVFNGKFKEQKNTDSTWTAVPETQVPKPRPGSCAGDPPAEEYRSSVHFPDQVLVFSKAFPLMDQSVWSVMRRPLFTRTNHRSRLVSVAVDVSAGPHWDQTILFLGSEDGRVLKVLLKTESQNQNQSLSPVLLEDIPVYDPLRCGLHGDSRVVSMELDRETRGLFVAFRSCVTRVSLSRCEKHRLCQRSCLASQDPYCIWLRTGRCENFSPGFKAGFEQDLDGDPIQYTEPCHGNVMATTRNHDSADSAYGVGPQSHVHVSLFVTFVFVAFSLGAILSGFLISCFCQGPAHRPTPLAKDPEASLPHALSLRSLAKLNGLLDHPSKERLDVSRLYSSLVNRSEQNLVQSQDQAEGGAAEFSPSKAASQSDGEFESTIPTPESTPGPRDRNQECPSLSGPVPSPSPTSSTPGFVAFVGHSSVFQSAACKSDSVLSNSTVGTTQFRTANPEPGHLGGGANHHLSQTLLPQVDVSALDELLRHIHEVSASGTGGIKVLTSTSSGLYPPLHPNHPHLQRPTHLASPTSSLAQPTHITPPPNTSTPHRATTTRTHHYNPRNPVSEPRSHTPRQLVKMATVHRTPSLKQPQPGILARMNTNSSSNGPPPSGNANAKAAVSLTRQHSYSEGPKSQRVAVRRSLSLKPQIPPKPLFLPNNATLTEVLTETLTDK